MEQKQVITVNKLKGVFKRNRLNAIVCQVSESKFNIYHLCGGATRMEWCIEGHAATCTDSGVIVDVSHTFVYLVAAMKQGCTARQETVVLDLLSDEDFMQYMCVENSGLEFSYIDVIYALACLNYPNVTNSQAREIANMLNEQL